MTNELNNSNSSIKRRAWTAKRRAAQAKRARRQKPWIKSTGPKTPQGKSKTAKNAYKHGFRGREMDEIRALLTAREKQVRSLLNASPPGKGGL